jgi:hypothetical protein
MLKSVRRPFLSLRITSYSVLLEREMSRKHDRTLVIHGWDTRAISHPPIRIQNQGRDGNGPTHVVDSRYRTGTCENKTIEIQKEIWPQLLTLLYVRESRRVLFVAVRSFLDLNQSTRSYIK